MTKKLIFFIGLLLFIGCTEQEEAVRDLMVDGNSLNYSVKREADDYQVPLDLILPELRINYNITDERITFGDVELIVGSDIAFVSENARSLNFPVVENDHILVSLNFLTTELNIQYVEDSQSVNIRFANSYLLNYEDALDIFKEGMTAKVTDLETGETFDVRRVEGSYKKMIADVEPKTAEDTATLLEIIGGEWNHFRRAILVEIEDDIIAGAILPVPHSGRDDRPFGDIVDNRSGNSGRGINLNSIMDNDMVGVVDIYFYNSIVPGTNRVDERAQEKVLEAAYFYRE